MSSILIKRWGIYWFIALGMASTDKPGLLEALVSKLACVSMDAGPKSR